MRYFGHSISRFAAVATFIALVSPLSVFAQVGYGGGGNGPILGTFGVIAPAIVGGGNFGGFNGSPTSGGLVLGASTFRFTQVLWRGMSGEDVVELQSILIALGFLDIPAPTGFFGLLTEEAVRAYQTAQGIEPIGIVGPITRAALNSYLASSVLPTPVISQN